MTHLEIAANVATAVSIVLAARNSIHTWWTGIIGCVLFGFFFFNAQLYADATLQIFFIVTSAMGWWNWLHTDSAHEPSLPAQRPVSQATRSTLAWFVAAALAVTVGYGGVLYRWTDAYLPFVDAGVLALSVVGQCLLMQRKIETWFFWLAVDTISVFLFASRGLNLTATLYAVYWVNAWYGWYRWRQECRSTAAEAL